MTDARKRNYSSWQWFVRNSSEVAAAQPSVLGGAPDVTELRARIRRARRTFNRLLGEQPAPVPLNVEVLDSVDCGTYERQHIVYDSERWMSVPAFLLVPHDRAQRGRPGAAILAQHGHGHGKAEVCGLAGGDEGGEANDYAHQLALRGYVVLAPDLRTFGERADWEPDNIYSCDHTYMYSSLLGHQLLALDLWDLARGLDVLSAHPLVDPRRLGMVGLSQGGTCTLFLSAWDRRIRAAVVSGYLNTWDSCATIGWNMCGSQVLKGIAPQLDHVDLGALVAPRPLLVETGTGDNIFPVEAARETMAGLRQIYATLGVPDRVEHDVFEGGHRWHGDRAYPFLARWLRHRDSVLMATTVQVTFDCADPHAMAAFWASAIGYVKEDHRAFVAELRGSGLLTNADTRDVDGGPQFADVSACRDPAGVGPRLFFQRVPEDKAGKNRVHLDLHVGPMGQADEVSRLEALGARKLWFSDDRGGPCWTMADLEGNEFCVD